MKKSLLTGAAILLFSAIYCWVFGFGSDAVFSKPLATGTITACWGCSNPVVETVVELINADNGEVEGTCTIVPPKTCCKITGDFPTGSYYFVYYQPDGVHCETSTFNYTNGTNVTLNVICTCP